MCNIAKTLFTRALLHLFVFSITLSTFSADPLTFRGHIISTERNNQPATFRFEVNSVDNNYSIWSAKGEAAPAFASGFDGLDSYTLENRQINPVLKHQFGHIYPGGFPEGDRMVNQVLWTAFCSSSFLNGNTNAVLPFYFFKNNRVRETAVTTSFVLMNSPSRLPKKLKSESPEFGIAYEVSNTTNILGLSIPVRATATVLLFNNANDHTSRKTYASYELFLDSAERYIPQHAKDVSALRTKLLPPVGTNVVFITDWRFKDEGHERLDYFVRDAGWPTRDARVVSELLRHPLSPR